MIHRSVSGRPTSMGGLLTLTRRPGVKVPRVTVHAPAQQRLNGAGRPPRVDTGDRALLARPSPGHETAAFPPEDRRRTGHAAGVCASFSGPGCGLSTFHLPLQGNVLVGISQVPIRALCFGFSGHTRGHWAAC